ncbi:hypothetical protein B0H17DRAFT_1126681 [Mycena rosella]|uniref:Uncharacterized protein n=1 Tax=Mycena rosella TaxID=1033263 RepID=A0AAD7M782_MYCRO|nr:hypothetical protein B0H17DRAFT_1126681 [Mycena rosella]
MSSAAHPELHLLKSSLRSIHESLADFRPLAPRPPILDSSTDFESGADSTDDAQWLQQENIPGLKQLRDALKIDLDVLERFLNDPDCANLAPLSTNAPYLIAVYHEVLCAPQPIVSIFKSFPPAPTVLAQKTIPVKVDVVADSGRRWIRVNTIKNARLMAEFREIDSYLTDSDSDDTDGPTLAQTEFDNSVLRMGRGLVAAAAHAHPTDAPQVTMRLTRLRESTTDPRIAQTLAGLRALGIDVQLGDRPPSALPAPPRPLTPAPLAPTAHINLDLSVLIALVSDLTHAPLPPSVAAAQRRFVPATQARALTSQIMQEMLQEMANGAFFHVLRTRLPPGTLRFWTTQEARARFERIVGKIGGPAEKQRAAALFAPAADPDAEARFWAASRYAPEFIPLLPVGVYPAGDEDAEAPPAAAARAPFFRAMEATCRGILAQEAPPKPDAEDTAQDATDADTAGAEPVLYSTNGFRRNAGSERATTTRANGRLTAHTVRSMLCGAARGWTTLTANRTSVRALLREVRAVGVPVLEDSEAREADAQESEAAAIWIVDPLHWVRARHSQSGSKPALNAGNVSMRPPLMANTTSSKQPVNSPPPRPSRPNSTRRKSAVTSAGGLPNAPHPNAPSTRRRTPCAAAARRTHLIFSRMRSRCAASAYCPAASTSGPRTAAHEMTSANHHAATEFTAAGLCGGASESPYVPRKTHTSERVMQPRVERRAQAEALLLRARACEEPAAGAQFGRHREQGDRAAAVGAQRERGLECVGSDDPDRRGLLGSTMDGSGRGVAQELGGAHSSARARGSLEDRGDVLVDRFARELAALGFERDGHCGNSEQGPSRKLEPEPPHLKSSQETLMAIRVAAHGSWVNPILRVECQKKDWKQHNLKRSVCTKPAILHQVDKMMKKHSGPGSPMASITAIEKVVWAERARNPQPIEACDGCFRRFRGVPPRVEEEEDENTPDAGDKFKHCTACDWTICKDCTHPQNQGIPYFDRPTGTCRCPTSNFGVSYCLSTPSYLDGDGDKAYHGDRHPPMAGSGYAESSFEKKDRECRTCGAHVRHLKKEHLKDAVPGII